MKIVYNKSSKTINDPFPEDVNKAYEVLENMWFNETNQEKNQKFIKHLIHSFIKNSISGFNFVYSIGEEQVKKFKDCLLNYKLITVSDNAKLIIKHKPIIYSAKKVLNELTEEDKIKMRVLSATRPIEVKRNRVAFSVKSSDKYLSLSSYTALSIFVENNYDLIFKKIEYTDKQKNEYEIQQEIKREKTEQARLEKNRKMYEVGETHFNNFIDDDVLKKLKSIK